MAKGPYSVRFDSGFTMVELLVTLAIAAILLGVVIPAFDSLVHSSRRSSEFNRFLGDLVFARSEAVKRSSAVEVCATTDQNQCSGSDWDGGWIVRVNSSGQVLRVGSPTKGGVNITASGFSNDGLISFSGDGKLEGGNVTKIGRFVFCDSRGSAEARGITFSSFGQYRQMRDTNSDGIVDYDVGGAAASVSC